MDDFITLILFIIFLGAVFAGGFYMGYRYRDDLSLRNQKKYRHSPPREASRAPAPEPSVADSTETVE